MSDFFHSHVQFKAEKWPHLNSSLIKASDLNIPAAKQTSYKAFGVNQMEYILATTGRRWVKSLW